MLNLEDTPVSFMVGVGIIVALCALTLNLAIALLTLRGQKIASSWVLVILLSGTTGAALTALVSVLAGENRYLDAALVFATTALIAVIVRAATKSPATPTSSNSPSAKVHSATQAKEDSS